MDIMFWNEELETIDRKALEKLQLEKLKASLAAASQTPFYGKVFEDNGIDISSIRSLEHLRDLPLTTKNDLRLSYPDGMVTIERKEIVRMHAPREQRVNRP